MNRSYNPDYVLQLPCDGIIMNVIYKYAFGRDKINYVEGIDFPKTADGKIDKQKIKRETEEYLEKFVSGTSIGRVFFNVSYTRAATPSKCMDTFAYNVDMGADGKVKSVQITYIPLETKGYPGFRMFDYTLRENIDLIGYGIDYVNANGREAWVSIRMNDHHAPDNAAVNAHYRIDYAAEWGINGKPNKMDYLVPAVRKVQLNYIKELCENYDISGVELDLLRSDPYMSRTDREATDIFSAFIRSVKEEINKIAAKKKKKIGLAVRVFATPEINLKFGLDVAQWVSEGLIDIVTTANFFQPVSFDLPMDHWRAAIAAKNVNNHRYTLLGGLDWGVMSSPLYHLAMNGAYTRGFVSSVYGNGGDGVYLFNTFNTEGHFATGYRVTENGVEEYNNFEERKNASESLAVAESALRRYVFSYFTTDEDVWNILPVTLKCGEKYAFDMQTGGAPKQGYFMAVVPVADENVSIEAYLNGKPMRQISDMRRNAALPYFPMKENGCNEVNHITQIGRRVLQFIAADLRDVNNGRNLIEINNMGETNLTLVWFEIFSDGRKNADPTKYDD